MVDDETLSSVLSDFARTLTTDFPIQAILDHLVERIVDVLPVTGAGVTLISAGVAPHHVAASNAVALGFERLQTELWQGPCLIAFETGEAVSVPDLGREDRFPPFTRAAAAAGMGAVFAFPLRHGAGRVGALDLYRDRPGPLDPQDMAAAQTLADVAAAYLLNAQARQDAREVSDRFRAGALHDALTGLPNRALLQQRIEHAAQRAHRSHSQAAVLFADLDRFKEVNDTYGHQVGDELLVAVARRLSAVVRPGDTLARVSGDEFVILCEDLAHVTDVRRLVTRIEDAFATPFPLAHLEVEITASVGIAYSGVGEGVSDQLISRADTAMYQAKRRGGATHQILDLHEADGTGGTADGRLPRDLHAALSRGDLGLAYQPIVGTRDGAVAGVEALLRWTHPAHGAVPALTAVGLAERSGQIGGLGAWVLERSCTDHGRWLAGHPGRVLDLSVNVSVRQLMSPGFSSTVAGILDATDMDPASLVLEVTEGHFIEDGSRATGALAALKALGVRLALDDFGTGYSSLGYLRRLPVDILKIDQSFVADIGRRAPGTAIVAAISDLAHVLGLSVTVEGVETEQQHDAVRSIGCDHAQGYLYGRPSPASAVPVLLRDGARGRDDHLVRPEGRASGRAAGPSPRTAPAPVASIGRGQRDQPRERGAG